MSLMTFYPNGSRSPQSAVPGQSQPVDIDRLTSHILTCWNEARDEKRPVELIMLNSLLARDNKYTEEKLRLLDPTKTTRVYIPISSTKCRDAKAWISDIIKPSERAWTIEPTPLPDLPPDVEQEIQAEIVAQYRAALNDDLLQYGIISDQTRDAMREVAEKSKERVLSELREEAGKRCQAMTQLIEDQLAEGGFIPAFDDFVDDLVTLKAGILKGPVIRNKKKQKWVARNGQTEVVYESELAKEVDRVDPFNFYPGKGCANINDTFVLERHKLSRTDLNDLLGVPGYSDRRIRAVLTQFMDAGGEWLAVDNKVIVEQAKRGYAGTTFARSERIDALEFWGSVPGKYLIEWGLTAEEDGVLIDPDLPYEVNAWLIDRWVIKAIINPDKLRRKPYSVTSYIKIPGSIWGKGIPELVEGSQEAGNAIGRGIVNNSAYASLPMTDVNIDRLAQSDDNAVYPGKNFKSTGQQMDKKVVEFYQPRLVANALVNVLEFWLRRADADSGVPAYAHGDANVGGAGNTASGLSMLVSMASRGIMNVVRNIDTDIFTPLITRFYDMNMLYHPDESVKGDARVVARGASGLMQKEQSTMRLKEFAAQTNNPVDFSIVGPRKRAYLLREVAKALEIDPNQAVGEEQELEQRYPETMPDMPGAGMLPPGGQPQIGVDGMMDGQGEAATLDQAGQPVAGQDARLFGLGSQA